MVLFFRAAAGIGRFFRGDAGRQAGPQDMLDGPDFFGAILIVVLVFGALIERAAFVVLHAILQKRLESSERKPFPQAAQEKSARQNWRVPCHRADSMATAYAACLTARAAGRPPPARCSALSRPAAHPSSRATSARRTACGASGRRCPAQFRTGSPCRRSRSVVRRFQGG